MNLFTYRLLTSIALPLIAYSGWKRCKKHQQQRQTHCELPEIPHCFGARFGLNPAQFQKNGIWIHSVSVGETRSIFPLLTELKQRYPDTPITVTNGSTQGAIQALQFAPVKVQHQMIPYDYSFAVNRFLDQIQPKLVIMIETEIWPNLYQACSKRQIPIMLANARLKKKSFQAYRKWGGKLMRNALNQTQLIAAQFPVDAQHFIELGADSSRVKTLGNLKFDMQLNPELRSSAEQWLNDNQLQQRFIWVAASTHNDPNNGDSEEQLVLDAHRKLLKTHPNALLILVPRHADRFNDVAELLNGSSFNWALRSRQQPINADTQVYLADTVGELMLWFASCNTAFIGGSLVPFGGHNILEPAALQKPVISGPYYANLKALFDSFLQDQAVTIIENKTDLAHTLSTLADSEDQQHQLGLKAYQSYQKQSGALQKLMHEIKPFLNDQA